MRMLSNKIIGVNFLIMLLFVISCRPSDDDERPLIFSSYNEATFSIRIFEVKTDSTFRFWRNSLFKDEEVNGTWELENDTFNLFVGDIEKSKIGRLYLQKRYMDGLPYYNPQFKCLDNSSLLFDLTYKRGSLRYHTPPVNIDFGVSRNKPAL